MEAFDTRYRVVAEHHGPASIVYLGNDRVDVQADLTVFGLVERDDEPPHFFDVRGRLWNPADPKFALHRMDQRGIVSAGGWRFRAYIVGKGGELALAGPVSPPEEFYDA